MAEFQRGACVEIPEFSFVRAIFYGFIGSLACWAATGAGESRLWWLAVPVAAVIGGFLSADDSGGEWDLFGWGGGSDSSSDGGGGDGD
jgi:hypothetical protein